MNILKPLAFFHSKKKYAEKMALFCSHEIVNIREYWRSRSIHVAFSSFC